MKKLTIMTIIFAMALTLCACTKKTAETTDLTNIMQESGLGYTIKYPTDWTYKRNPNDSIVIMQSAESIDPLIQIQKYKTGEQYNLAQDAIDAWKNAAKELAPKTEFFAEKDYIVTMTDGTQLNGKQIVSNSPELGLHQKMIVIPNKAGNTIYQWTFVATSANYNKYLKTANAVLDSWEIQ